MKENIEEAVSEGLFSETEGEKLKGFVDPILKKNLDPKPLKNFEKKVRPRLE